MWAGFGADTAVDTFIVIDPDLRDAEFFNHPRQQSERADEPTEWAVDDEACKQIHANQNQHGLRRVLDIKHVKRVHFMVYNVTFSSDNSVEHQDKHDKYQTSNTVRDPERYLPFFSLFEKWECVDKFLECSERARPAADSLVGD